jgi:putative zinc finger/helix-turn-helix YgiT family protein
MDKSNHKMVKSAHDCESCASKKTATLEHPYHFIESGLPNVYLSGIRYSVCTVCNQTTAEIPAIESLMQVIARAVVEREANLSGPEIRFLRKRLGKKAFEFAGIVGVSPEQLSRWENESNLPESATDKLIRLCYAIQSGDSELRMKLKGLSESLKDIPTLHPMSEIRASLNKKQEWKALAAAAGN